MLKQALHRFSKQDDHDVVIFAYNNKMIKLIILLAALLSTIIKTFLT